MGVVGIVLRQQRHELRVEVAVVLQPRLVDRHEHAGLDLPREERQRRHDDVVAGVAGHQLRLEQLVGIEHVVGDGDAGLGLEVRQRVLGDVVRPVVDVEHAAGVGGGCGGAGRRGVGGAGRRRVAGGAAGGHGEQDQRGEQQYGRAQFHCRSPE
jgi:hypothetical protein